MFTKFVNKFTKKLAILVSVCLSSEIESTLLSRVVFAKRASLGLADSSEA